MCSIHVRANLLHQLSVLNKEELDSFLRTDDKGIICDQRGVFRVNCMDCLDRTNVVQAALARHIMEQQVNKMLNKEIDGSSDFFHLHLCTTRFKMCTTEITVRLF